MTVPEAQERLEALTVNLASCPDSIQRGAIEAQIARYHGIIQKARQRAHRSLTSVAATLLEIDKDALPNEQEIAALIAAAHLIRCASIEQLAIAVPAAIHEVSTNCAPPGAERFQEFADVAACLLKLDRNRLSLEQKLAVRTALDLISVLERSQIHHSIRRASASASGLGPTSVLNRLREIYSGFFARPGGFLVKAGTKRGFLLTAPAAKVKSW